MQRVGACMQYVQRVTLMWGTVSGAAWRLSCHLLCNYASSNMG
jgi:hypothetical protein